MASGWPADGQRCVHLGEGEGLCLLIPAKGGAGIGRCLPPMLPLACFFLKVGYAARPSKKVRKALSRWRNACCNATLDTSCSHTVSGCCFSVVSAADSS